MTTCEKCAYDDHRCPTPCIRVMMIHENYWDCAFMRRKTVDEMVIDIDRYWNYKIEADTYRINH